MSAFVSVESSGIHEILIRLSEFNSEAPGSFVPRSEVKITAEEAMRVAGNLIVYATGIFQDREERARVGDCDLCKNTWLVQKETHGRKVSVACPNCNPRTS